jgi:hypothetical protein
MRKRILNGTPLWIVKDSEYLKYVPQAREDANDEEDNSDVKNPQCYGCVDRHEGNDCPTFYALGLTRNSDGVCNQRVLNAEGVADFISKRMEVI